MELATGVGTTFGGQNRIDDRLAVLETRTSAAPVQHPHWFATAIQAAFEAAVVSVSALEQHLNRGRYASMLPVAFCIAIALGGRLWR